MNTKKIWNFLTTLISFLKIKLLKQSCNRKLLKKRSFLLDGIPCKNHANIRWRSDSGFYQTAHKNNPSVNMIVKL